MPQLSDLMNRRPGKKFIKKEYRPYDLQGTNEDDISIVEKKHNMEKNCAEIKGNDKDNILDNDKDNIWVTDSIKGNVKDNIKITTLTEKGNKQGNDKDNNLDNTIDNNNINSLTDSIRKLMGLQRKIFFYIIDICSSHVDLKTNPILTSDLATIANCSRGSVKTSLIRLISKNLIVRNKGQNARGGHLILSITKEVQTAALKAQHISYMGNNLDNIKGNKLDNVIDNSNFVYNSSSNNINTTTNINRARDLPEEWRNIDIQPLEHIGFSQTQIKQLHTINTNTPQVIQESIYQFAFGLENNPKVQSYNDPLNVFMGLLRKGGSWVEKDYISPKVKAEREMLAAMEKELAELKEIEEKKFETSFSIWHLKLNNSDKETILLKYPKIEEGSKFSEMAKIGNIKKYFKEEVYSKS